MDKEKEFVQVAEVIEPAPAVPCCAGHGCHHAMCSRRNIIIGILAAILVFSAVVLTYNIFARHLVRDKVRTAAAQTQTDVGNRIGDRMGGGRMRDGSDRPAAGNMLFGVVTAVDGSTLTVAGHGTTTKVTVNSSTQYVNGSSAKVNDTVRVIGTQSNGAWTASRIKIN